MANLYEGATYNLPIEIMLFDHHNIYRLWVLKGEKSETPGSTAGAVTHDCALSDLAELAEVFFQRLCCARQLINIISYMHRRLK